MSEDIKQEVIEDKQVLTLEENIEKQFLEAQEDKIPKIIEESSKERVFSDIEKDAMTHGWRPKDEFDDKSGKRFIPADEFMDRQSFFKKIDSVKGENNHLKKIVKDLGEHLKKTEEAAYKRALEQLNLERQEAVRNGDQEKFNTIEGKMLKEQERIQDLNKLNTNPEKTIQYEDSKSGINLDLSEEDKKELQELAGEFFKRNSSWFDAKDIKNKPLIDYAINHEKLLAEARPDLTHKERLLRVEEDVKRTFSSRFENQRSLEPSTVATKEIAPTGTKTTLAAKLTPQQRDFAQELVRLKAYSSTEEYAKDLQLQGALKND